MYGCDSWLYSRRKFLFSPYVKRRTYQWESSFGFLLMFGGVILLDRGFLVLPICEFLAKIRF